MRVPFALLTVLSLGGQSAAMNVKPLAANAYLASSASGNSGIVIGKSGVMVIDAQATPEAGRALLNEVAKLTSLPVTHVLLTSGDPDHIGGLPAFPSSTTVIAYGSAIADVLSAAQAPGRRSRAPSHATQAIARTGEDETIDGVAVQFRHWAPAHTSGDLVVYLPQQQIVFGGDTMTATSSDPVVAFDRGGSSEGFITATKGMLGVPATTFVPAHGAPHARGELQTKLGAVIEKRDKIAQLVRDGKSLDEIKAVFGESPAAAGARPTTLIEVVFRELSGKL